MFDASDPDRRRAFKYFVANFRDFCIMEDFVNPAKDVDSDDYWIGAKRPKAMAALRRAFPPQEWDVLTTTIDTQISEANKLNPAAWLQELTKHYLGAEPIIQITHHFLRILKQKPSMSIQDWQTAVRFSFQKWNFPVEAEDRLQRDIFVIGLNDTYKSFRSDVISRETFDTLTFAQVIAKARDFEDSFKTESSIAQHHLEEAVNKISSNKIPQAQTSQQTPKAGSTPFQWCGKPSHRSRRECPAKNAGKCFTSGQLVWSDGSDQRLALEMLFKLLSLLKSILCLQLCILLGDVTDGHLAHLGSAQTQRSVSDVSTMLFLIWRGYWISGMISLLLDEENSIDQAALSPRTAQAFDVPQPEA